MITMVNQSSDYEFTGFLGAKHTNTIVVNMYLVIMMLKMPFTKELHHVLW